MSGDDKDNNVLPLTSTRVEEEKSRSSSRKSRTSSG